MIWCHYSILQRHYDVINPYICRKSLFFTNLVVKVGVWYSFGTLNASNYLPHYHYPFHSHSFELVIYAAISANIVSTSCRIISLARGVMSGNARRGNFCVGLPCQNRQKFFVWYSEKNKKYQCVVVGNKKILFLLIMFVIRKYHSYNVFIRLMPGGRNFTK